MKLQLNKDFRISTIPMNFMLEKSRVVEKKDSKRFGETDWVAMGYYPTLDQALNGFVKHSMLESDAEGVDEVKVLLRDVTEAVAGIKAQLSEVSK